MTIEEYLNNLIGENIEILEKEPIERPKTKILRVEEIRILKPGDICPMTVFSKTTEIGRV